MTTRRLGYDDRFTQYLTNTIASDTAGDSVFNDLVLDSDTTYDLVLTLTGAQYMKMFAALMTGADLSFQEDSHEIVWLLWKAGKNMDFCSKVADCIKTSQVVNDALIDVTINNGTNGGQGNPNTPLSDEILQENLLPDGYTCDNDHRYGTAVGIVEAIHKATLEVFEAIEVLTDPLELAAEVADNIPIAEAASVAADVAAWVQETIYELYILAWSETVRDEISCEIFCAMLPYDPCHLSFEMVWDIYKDLSGITPPEDNTSWEEWFDFLVSLPSLIAVDTVKAAGLLGLLCMRYGAAFGDFLLGVRSFKTTIALLADDTNPDWSTLCTQCDNRWEHTWYFNDDTFPNGWGVTTHGQWVQNVGVKGGTYVEGGYNKHGIINLRLFGLIERCDTVRIDGTQTKGSFSGNFNAQAFFLLDSNFNPIGLNVVRTQAYVFNGVLDLDFGFNLTNAANGLYIQMLTATTNVTPYSTGDITITSVTLEGEGEDPFA